MYVVNIGIARYVHFLCYIFHRCSWLRNSKPGSWGAKMKRGDEEAERLKVENKDSSSFLPVRLFNLLSGCLPAYWPIYCSLLLMNGN